MEELMRMSETEMVALWRQLMNLDVPLRDCVVERDDGIDIDGLLRSHIRIWYDNLLRTAPSEMLPVKDVSGEVTAEADASGVVTLTLPMRCVRLLEVQMQGWSRPVSRFVTADSPEAQMQSSPWLRGGCEQPVAVKHADRVVLFGIEPGSEPVVKRALAVMRPDTGFIEVARGALATIPRFDDLVR
ncbi:MAG: hypothetical protein ACI4AH_07965 [Muribaculaceae bacterium]